MYLYLAGNNKLLTDVRLGDDDAQALYKTLQNNLFVVSLDLRYNNITDKGAQYIAKLIEVRQQKFYFYSFTDFIFFKIGQEEEKN